MIKKSVGNLEIFRPRMKNILEDEATAIPEELTFGLVAASKGLSPLCRHIPSSFRHK